MEVLGHWVGPMIIDHVTLDMPASREEIFGPVLSTACVPSIDAAIELENNSIRNAAAVFTSNGGTAHVMERKLNAVKISAFLFPENLGGWNDSKFGHGDLTGFDGYRFWTRPRKVTRRGTTNRSNLDGLEHGMTSDELVQTVRTTASTPGVSNKT